MATPRYLTPRTDGTVTYGPHIARMSALLGHPLMPWQRQAADLIGEVYPDDLVTDVRGNRVPRPVHKTIVVTVPRQSGKTALLFAVMLQRLARRKAARAWYTAQTGMDARDNLNELSDVIDLSTLKTVMHSKRGAGDTSIALERFGSRVKAHPPTPGALHGKQSDLNVIDEAWEYSEDQGHAVLGGVNPAQSTRPMAQTIIVSTAGTAASTWFHEFVDKGYAGQICLIDYGIAPDADPDDDTVIAAAHPAIGYAQDIGVIAEARKQLTPGEVTRAYGNRRTRSAERSIPQSAWTAARWPTKIPDHAPVAFAAAASIDGEDTAICVAAVVDGVPVVEHIESRPGTSWAPDRLQELSARQNHAPIVLDPMGPAGPIAASLADHHALHRVTAEELTTACADVLERIKRHHPDTLAPAPAIGFRPDPILDTAAENAARRFIGDRWAWSRRGSAGSSAALEAGTLAAAHVLHMPEQIDLRVYFG